MRDRNSQRQKGRPRNRYGRMWECGSRQTEAGASSVQGLAWLQRETLVKVGSGRTLQAGILELERDGK